MEEEAADLKGINSHRAHLSAYVLIAGLLLELIASVVWFKGVETVVGMVAVLLIVGGVWGEVFFGKKASDAGDKELAKYKARAAEAEDRALATQLRLEKFRKPWTLPSWMLPDFEKLLTPFAGTPYRILAMNDHDQLQIAARLRQAFTWARWPAATPVGHPGGGGISFIPEYDGIEIRIDQSRSDDWLAAAQAISEVFKVAEIDAPVRAMESGTPADAIHIFIGRKI